MAYLEARTKQIPFGNDKQRASAGVAEAGVDAVDGGGNGAVEIGGGGSAGGESGKQARKGDSGCRRF